eukprot:3720339-Pyramimonas_sp.AAC.1
MGAAPPCNLCHWSFTWSSLRGHDPHERCSVLMLMVVVMVMVMMVMVTVMAMVLVMVMVVMMM